MKKMICIECPRGCHLEVEGQEVRGNRCPRGVIYAINEITRPKRGLATTVMLRNGEVSVVPVKTSEDIPKDRIFDVMQELSKVTMEAPVKMGDIIIKNILDLGVDIVVTRSIKSIKD